jgi:hypothetical protein
VIFFNELCLILVIGIHFLHMVTCDFLSSKYGDFFFIPQKNLCKIHIGFSIVTMVQKFAPKNSLCPLVERTCFSFHYFISCMLVKCCQYDKSSNYLNHVIAMMLMVECNLWGELTISYMLTEPFAQKLIQILNFREQNCP